MQNIVVIGRVYFTLECFEFSSNFEFDRNMLSGTGASCALTKAQNTNNTFMCSITSPIEPPAICAEETNDVTVNIFLCFGACESDQKSTVYLFV